MIDFTTTEALLFAWGAIATVFVFYYKNVNDLQNRMVIHMLDDPSVFEKVSADYQKWKEKRGIV